MQLITSNKASEFFNILPEDWQESIKPHWDIVKDISTVYVLESDNEICAGGIVFSGILPEMDEYKNEALHWFSKHFLYIGYVWVPIDKRNKQYGTLWLKKLFELNKKQQYWLTTEDKNLLHFYEKSGFKHLKELQLKEGSEDLFIKEVN